LSVLKHPVRWNKVSSAKREKGKNSALGLEHQHVLDTKIKELETVTQMSSRVIVEALFSELLCFLT
jgi:hypothetical protein